MVARPAEPAFCDRISARVILRVTGNGHWYAKAIIYNHRLELPCKRFQT